MKHFFKFLDNLEEIAMVAGMLVMVVVNFLNVFSRYLLPQSPFSFTEELTVLLFVWVTMFGIGCGYKRHAHTGLTLVTDILPKFWQRIFVLLSMVGSMAVFIALIILGTQMVQGQLQYGQIMTALKIPEAVAGLSIPVGGVFVLIRVIQVGITDFIQLGKPKGNDEKGAVQQ